RRIAPSQAGPIIAGCARALRDLVLNQAPAQAGRGDPGFENHRRRAGAFDVDVKAASADVDQSSGGTEPQDQADMAQSPATMRRVRGSTPDRASHPIIAKIATNTASFTTSDACVRGKIFQSAPSASSAAETAHTLP